MSPPGAVPPGEDWYDPSGWLTQARRRGPLRYSDLGRRRLPVLAADEAAAVGTWIAGAAEEWWADMGHPDPYTLVVMSGDDGRLARRVLAAVTPAFSAALRYVLVDPAASPGSGPPPGMAGLAALEEPAYLYPVGGDAPELDDEELDRPPAARRIGPLVTFLTEVPSLGEAPGAVVAVSVLSRLPYELYQNAGDGWAEVRLAAGDGELFEITVPVSGRPAGEPDGAGAPVVIPPDAPGPARLRRLSGATEWLRGQVHSAEDGILAVLDRWEGPGDTDALDLAQMRHVRTPLDAGPEPVPGTDLSAVKWRIG